MYARDFNHASVIFHSARNEIPASWCRIGGGPARLSTFGSTLHRPHPARHRPRRQRTGNTSAAGIPLTLSKLVMRREVEPGTPILLFGFGGGLSCAGQIVRCS
jgi:3-hydroxy-3-methylglutaryl CoA synthase